MALKINTQIGTDRGITSEAYVRIANYSIAKTGSAHFQLQLFLNKEEAVAINPQSPYMSSAVNQQIGNNLYVSLLKEVATDVIQTRSMPSQQPVEKKVPMLDETGKPVFDEAGEAVVITTTEFETVITETSYTETIITQVPDMSLLEDKSIFEFGYAKLNDHLSALFGAENIENC